MKPCSRCTRREPTSEIAGNGAVSSAQKTDQATKTQTAAIRMKLVGENEVAPITAEHELPGQRNYFIGNDRSKWHAGVKQYAAVLMARCIRA